MLYGFTDEHLAMIRRKINAYRAGMDALPQAYVELHRAAADANTPALLKLIQGGNTIKRIITTEMVSDGWFDGMRVLRVIAEDSTGNLRDFRWSDSNGGSWFERMPSGGQKLVTVIGTPGYM